MLWTIIGSILLGALVGWIANRLLTGWIILSRLLGVQDSGWLVSLIMSVAGSCLVLWLVNVLRK